MGYRYDWDTKAVGLLLAGVGVCQLIVQGGLVGRMVKRSASVTRFWSGSCAALPDFTIQAMAPNGAMYAMGISSCRCGDWWARRCRAMTTRLVSPSEQGQLQGANSSVLGIADADRPAAVHTDVRDFIGAHRDWHLPGAPFLLSAILVVAALAVALRVMATRLQSLPATPP